MYCAQLTCTSENLRHFDVCFSFCLTVPSTCISEMTKARHKVLMAYLGKCCEWVIQLAGGSWSFPSAPLSQLEFREPQFLPAGSSSLLFSLGKDVSIVQQDEFSWLKENHAFGSSELRRRQSINPSNPGLAFNSQKCPECVLCLRWALGLSFRYQRKEDILS